MLCIGPDLNFLVLHARGQDREDKGKPRITVMIVGVDDVEQSLTFYREGHGLPTRRIIGMEVEYGAVAFFGLQHILKLAIWARKDIAHEANVPLGLPSAMDFTLGYTVARKAEASEVMRRTKQAGARITDRTVSIH